MLTLMKRLVRQRKRWQKCDQIMHADARYNLYGELPCHPAELRI